MTWQTVKIASVILPIQRWNPARTAPDEELDYIDLSSVDKDNKTITGTTTYIGAEAPSRAQQIVRTGDILVSTVRPNLNGVACVAQEFDGSTASTGYCVLRPDTSRIDPRYLFHWVKTQGFIDEMVKKATGANYPAISDATVKNSEIPLPPLLIQQRIAAVLDEVDALRQRRKASTDLTRTLISIEFIQRFGTFNNSVFPLMSLSEVCLKIVDGAHFTPTYVKQGIPFLRVTDIQDDHIDFGKVKRIPLSEHEELIKRCNPEIGDVLYSKNGTIGIPKLIDWSDQFSIFVSLALLKPKRDTIRSQYLESFLKTPQALAQALSHTKTGTVSNLHLVEIRKIQIPVPSLTEQDQWISRIGDLNNQVAILRMAGDRLSNFQHSIQSRAFSGALSLRALETVF